MPRPTLLNWLVPLIGALALAAGAWALWALWRGAVFFRGLVEPPAGRGE